MDHGDQIWWVCCGHGFDRRISVEDLEQDWKGHGSSCSVEEDCCEEKAEGVMGKLFLDEAE